MRGNVLNKARRWRLCCLVAGIVLSVCFLMELILWQFKVKDTWNRVQATRAWAGQLAPQTSNEEKMKKAILYCCWVIGGAKHTYWLRVTILIAFIYFAFGSYVGIGKLLREVPDDLAEIRKDDG